MGGSLSHVLQIHAFQCQPVYVFIPCCKVIHNAVSKLKDVAFILVYYVKMSLNNTLLYVEINCRNFPVYLYLYLEYLSCFHSKV